jgi:nucleoside-diphosphate-sugar epimerase
MTEEGLDKLADKNFRVTSLRFATACGMSERLRLDLVLNDFVASALSTGKITVLSDGTPWRPLINVQDMARAIDWALTRDARNGGDHLIVNTGSDVWNYQVKDLANAVAEAIHGTEVSINTAAPPDKRSYQVDFSLFTKLAPNHLPQKGLRETVEDLRQGLDAMHFNSPDFRNSAFMRLRVLTALREQGALDETLSWAHAVPTLAVDARS